MTTDPTRRGDNGAQASSGRNWFRLRVLAFGLLVAAVMLVLFLRSWLFAPPALQPGDLLLLEPESIARVEAAAKAGDIVAQSSLGFAYLEGRTELPRNVTNAVYWLRKVADRDRSQFERIPRRMQALIEKRQHEYDPRKRHALDAEYLDLVAQKLASEAAFLGLIEVYLGRHGVSYVNTEVALNYMKRGAAYGFPSAQRMLGLVTEFGLLGVPRNENEAEILLSEAAAKGDPVAHKLLVDLHSYHRILANARVDTASLEGSFW